MEGTFRIPDPAAEAIDPARAAPFSDLPQQATPTGKQPFSRRCLSVEPVASHSWNASTDNALNQTHHNPHRAFNTQVLHVLEKEAGHVGNSGNSDGRISALLRLDVGRTSSSCCSTPLPQRASSRFEVASPSNSFTHQTTLAWAANPSNPNGPYGTSCSQQAVDSYGAYCTAPPSRSPSLSSPLPQIGPKLAISQKDFHRTCSPSRITPDK